MIYMMRRISMKMNNRLIHFDEPCIEFGYSQASEDSRDGLTLFGPYETTTGEMKIGVIGTSNGIEAYKSFSKTANDPIYTNSAGRPFFPGFHSVFGLKWTAIPMATIVINESDINRLIATENLYERTYQLVSIFLDALINYIKTEEKQVNLWYIIIPREIWIKCRPQSYSKGSAITKKRIQIYKSGQISLFPVEDEQIASFLKMYESDSDFHDQMKARLLFEKFETPVQIMVEDTLLFRDKTGKPYNDDMRAHVMWTQSTSLYYKLGYLPWKLTDIREGVCYIGLVFKTLQGYQQREGYACCAAQMFLDSGDGMVFRGNIGPWKSTDEKTYHLNAEAAYDLIDKALNSYHLTTGDFPKELFIHGRTQFTDEEWLGFNQAIKDHDERTKLVGVTIDENDSFKLYKDNHSKRFRYGIMRGLALIVDERNAYLWTKGFIPRIETTNHLEVARPLRITVSRGDCSIETVLKDILCLTKLNYNACLYGDGLPVTLRFSDKIGNILTAINDVNWKALPFKYYI